MKKATKIAICDLLMCWPPDAGAFVDVVTIATMLSEKADVLLIVPKIDHLIKDKTTVFDRILSKYTRFFLRGYVDGQFPFEVRRIPFDGIEFRPSLISQRYNDELERFQPNKTFIANGWHLKAHLILGLAKWRPILRIYAHESLCVKADGWFFRSGRMCNRNYLSEGWSDYLACLLCSSSFYARYPAVRWIQDYTMAGAFKPTYPQVVRSAFAAASTVIVYNRWTAARILPYNQNVRIIPSGVDCELFHPAEEIVRGATRIVVPGRVREQHKGREFLKGVMQSAERTNPETEFHITGVKQGFSGHNVREIGWLSLDKLPSLYRSSHIAFIPSLWPEPQGIVALEAMASGLPVVASSVGGLKEMVQDGETGFLVSPGDVEMATERLKRLINDPDLRRRMGANGRRLCLETYSWRKIFNDYYRPLFLADS